MAEQVHKVTLSTGKVVLLREPRIKHQELAASAVGSKYQDQPAALNVAVQTELVKMMLVKVGDKTYSQQEALDDVISFAEFRQIMKVMEQLSGVGDKDPLIEVVSFGDK